LLSSSQRASRSEPTRITIVLVDPHASRRSASCSGSEGAGYSGGLGEVASRRTLMRILGWLICGLLMGCAGDDAAQPTACSVGSEGCDCTPGGGCDAPLECRSKKCVSVPGNTGGAGGSSAGAAGSSSAGMSGG